MKMDRRLASCTALLATVALIACGGGTPSAPAATPGAVGGTAGPVAPSATSGGGGGSAADDVCALLTVAEAAGAMNTDPLTSSGTAGDPAACRYLLKDGEEALTTNVLRNGANAQYQAFVANGSGDSVTGVGDEALFERGTRRLVFKVAAVLVSVFPRYVGGADAALAASTAMGKIITARLTTGSVPPALQVTAPPVIAAKAACELLSADEAAGVLAKGPMSSEANAATPQFCTYAVVSSAEVILSTFLQTKGGGASWTGFESSLTTDPVSGLGDQAMFEPSSGILFVLKGDTLLNVNVSGLQPAETLNMDRRLGEVMLGHL